MLDIDFKKTAAAFEQLGVDNFETLYSQNAANSLFEDLETGAIDHENFYQQVQQYCKAGTSFSDIQQAWNQILIGFRLPSLQYLQGLKERYSLYLLSNTNGIHKKSFEETLMKATGHATLDFFFTKTYYSHLMQRRKPYKNTYRFVLENAGITPGETLFIDDSVTNVQGAARAGLKTHLLLPEEKIELLNL